MSINRERMDIGVIGQGFIGTVHADVLSRTPLDTVFNLTSVAGGPGYSDTVNYPDAEALIHESGVEAVSVATPPFTHFEIAKYALLNRKHVLLEKPPVLVPGQLQELTDIADEHGVTLFTGYHAVYHPEVTAAARELSDVDIQSLAIRYGELVTNYHDPKGWIFNPEIAGGGILMDSGTNAISIVSDIFRDKELTVTGAQLENKDGFAVETKANVSFSLGDTTSGTLEMDWFREGSEIREIEFQTEKGELVLDIVKQQLRRDGSIVFGNEDDRAMVDQHSEYTSMFGVFYEHIARKESFASDRPLRFVLDCYAAARG